MAIPDDSYEINQGDTFQREYIVTSGGSPFNLTGYAVNSQYRETFADFGSIVVALTAVVTNAVAGTLLVSLTSAQTAALTSDIYYHDVQITSPAGVVTTIAEGYVTLNREVTR